MAFTLTDALSKIGTTEYSGVDGLIRLVNETSAVVDNAAANATTLLYSGNIGNSDIKVWQLINDMKSSFVDADGYKQVVTLADTAVSDLLNNEQFKSALRDAAGDDQYKLIMDGKDASNSRVTNTGLWDVASRMFAESAVGDVRTITPNAIENSVFNQTEFPALLANDKLTSINGIPREDLFQLQADLVDRGVAVDKDAANRMLFDYVNNASAEHISEMKVAVDADGKFVGVDAKEYFNKIGVSGVGTELPSGIIGQSPADWIGPYQTEGALSNSQAVNDYLKQYGQERYALAEAAGDASKMAEAGRYLNKLGISATSLACLWWRVRLMQPMLTVIPPAHNKLSKMDYWNTSAA